MPKFYTSVEVADILRLKQTTIRAYIRDKKLVAAKFGNEYRISEEDLKRFIESSKTT
ncbi:helix-turn-helix domain-containing protein [Shigella flexneri]|nr:helix-turn-helix domain-containing protein [Shigella flexneri]